MFFKLIIRNANRSLKENLIYFATLVVAVASFYIILSLEKQDVIIFLKEFESDAINKLLALMPIVYGFALFLLFFLILFANRYQLNRRSKEFGMYLLLGMRKERLILQLLAEGMFISIWALISGLFIGAFLAELISLTVAKLVGQGIISHQFSLSLTAIVFTVIGFLLIQFIALLILGGKLFYQEIYQLLNDQMDKKQEMGDVKGNIFHIFIGTVLLVIAYWLALFRFNEVEGFILFLAFVLGCIGTILFIKGFGKLLGIMASRSEKKSTKGLRTFTFRQFQENVAHKYLSVSVTSILMTLSIILIADGASSILSLDKVYNRETSVYDFTVYGEKEKVEQFLTSEEMAPYVADLNLLEIGRMKYRDESGEDELPLSLVDWSELRNQLIQILPKDYREQVLSGTLEGYSFSPEYPEAINLFNVLDIDVEKPNIIPESSYNGILEAMGEKPLNLRANEIALYFNPEFMPMQDLDNMPVLDQIIEKAEKEGKSLMKINDQEINIRPSIPMRGLVADRSVRIFSAFIVPDQMFEQLLSRENYTSYWNFRIPQTLQDEQGLMMPMKEVSEKLSAAGFGFESYLHNFGRQLFYVVAGSYTILYMGFLFLIIACTVLALQFLTQMKETKKRFLTLTMLGAKREQMKKSLRMQVLLTFLLPISLAVVSGAIGIWVMIKEVLIHIENNPLLYPMALFFACIVLGIFGIYGVAVARTAEGEIDKLRWKTNVGE